MADIKTRDTSKGTIKTINKAAVATERMKKAYVMTKDKAEHSTNASEHSAEEYASDKIEAATDKHIIVTPRQLPSSVPAAISNNSLKSSSPFSRGIRGNP